MKCSYACQSSEHLIGRRQFLGGVAAGAGAMGMVGGQVADLEAERKKPTRTLVDYIHTRKTAALLRAAVRAGALVGGASLKSSTFVPIIDAARKLSTAT